MPVSIVPGKAPKKTVDSGEYVVNGARSLGTASDVALWTNHRAEAGEVDLAALAHKAAALVPSGSTSVHLDANAGREPSPGPPGTLMETIPPQLGSGSDPSETGGAGQDG